MKLLKNGSSDNYSLCQKLLNEPFLIISDRHPLAFSPNEDSEIILAEEILSVLLS